MNKDDVDEFLAKLISLLNGIINLDTFKEILIPNYTDIEGNSYFHFLTEYSFEEFCLRNMKLSKDQKPITMEQYNSLKNEYIQQINFCIKTLLELNCDLFFVNGKNQSPLLFSINNNNYLVSLEYLKVLQNIGIYTKEDYYDFLDTILKKGNCFNKDCIELINLILSNIDSIESSKYEQIPFIISLLKNFSINVYEGYNEIVKTVSLEYINKEENGIILEQNDDNIKNIKNKANEIFNDYINKNILPLTQKLIILGGDFQYNKESAFNYLMSYPFILDLKKFVEENKIDINFKNEEGNTPIMNLINNKEYITQISKDTYDNAFNCLLDINNLDISIQNKKGNSAFYLCLIKDYFKEAKAIYQKFKNFFIADFNSNILNIIIEKDNPEKIIELLNIFKDDIDFNLFNIEHKQSLLHYISLYLSDDTHISTFTQIINYIDNLKIDYLLKDQYDRNFLFYLFLDENDNSKINDPIKQLEAIFEKYKFNNLNEKDIFGNELIFYVIQSNAEKCVDLLLNNGIILPKEQYNNENSIFSISLLNQNFRLFKYLYDEIENPNVFNHKVYEPYKIINSKNENSDPIRNKKGETLYDFLNKNNLENNGININNNNNLYSNTLYNNNINKINKKNLFKKKNNLNDNKNNLLNNNMNNFNNKNLFINNINNNLFSNNTNNNLFSNNINNNIFSSNINNNPFSNNINNFNNSSLFNNNMNNLNNNNNLFNNSLTTNLLFPNNKNNIQSNKASNNQKEDEYLFDDNISNVPNNESKINSDKNEFNYFNFLDDITLKNLNDYTKNITIKSKGSDNNNINIIEKKNNLKNNPTVNDFIKNNDDYIVERINCKRNIISENIFRYCLSNNFEDICKFIINKNYNLISICNDLIFFQRHQDINDCILKIISQNNNDQSKLINLKDEKGQTIYHLIPFMKDSLFICKKLENHDISNIYDLEGNTPMFNACKNFDINFIKIFSHYTFSFSDNEVNNVNYDLFLETKNNKTPLEALCEQLNKKEDKLLKLIIDISINKKTVAFIPVIKYLIQNYSPYNNEQFKTNYQINLNSIEYLKKVIGLYQFYTNVLNGDIMIKDEDGNDPFIICAENNNFDFMFNVLLEEHNIRLNSTNKEGKSIIHLILQLSEYLNEYKKNLLKRAIEAGFDFNIKDNDGLLPLDYAFIEGNNEAVNLLIDYYTNFGIQFQLNSNINIKPNNKLKYDYNKDSDTFYNESISVSMNIDKNENLNDLVCKYFHYDELVSFYQVCVDDDKIPFSANLVKKNFNNMNHFNDLNDKKYYLQIIRDINKVDEYLTIAGDNSNLKTFTFKDFISAQQKFKDIFKEITDNEWDNVKNNRLNFKTDYSKYYIFDYTYEEENAIYDYLKITIKNLYIKKKSEYKGNIKIKNLIYYLLVKSYQNKFSIDDNNLNVEQNTKNIIEKYKSTAIRKAISILSELKKLLNSKFKDEKYYRKRNYLINSYNDLIPFSKKSKDLNVFNDSLNIDYEISRLTNYYYIENVLKIFLGAIYNLNNIHPIDYIINALGCKIEEIPKPRNNKELITESDYIYNFVNSTNSMNAKITAIYKITQSINDKNFNLNNFDNRYIFFHGTKVENVIGILSQGLKISPVQAVFTGNSYGTGIYLSDNFSCSLGYCSYSRNIFNYRNNFNINNNNNINNYLSDNKKFMFMAEVAVGKIGYDADTNVVNMSMNFDNYFTTNEGYRIFKNSKKMVTVGGKK